MTLVLFRTEGAIPLDAFKTFGINSKPRSNNPFGFFGTGLKYAVAVILRHKGSFRLFVKGVEYEFYLNSKDFRGKEFSQIRMRKRKRGMLSWMRSAPLPFTTELGKNWELWQAYRELESNTRDEGGETIFLDDLDFATEDFQPEPNGTDILIDCDGFFECGEHTTETIDDRHVHNAVFLDRREVYGELKVVHDSPTCTVYEGASKCLYYQGIRVYDPRNPTRFTYDFKPGKVELSEDRSAKNIWSMQYDLSHEIQWIADEDMLKDMLSVEPSHWFETDDLTFYGSGQGAFRRIAQWLYDQEKLGRSGRAFYLTHVRDDLSDSSPTTSITLKDTEWEIVVEALRDYDHPDADDIASEIGDSL